MLEFYEDVCTSVVISMLILTVIITLILWVTGVWGIYTVLCTAMVFSVIIFMSIIHLILGFIAIINRIKGGKNWK